MEDTGEYQQLGAADVISDEKYIGNTGHTFEFLNQVRFARNFG